jgi:hypothetical protein
MWIIEDGQSDYQILTVTPAWRGGVAEHAARNLQEGLLRMTGLRLPVRGAHQRVAGRPAIVVGGEVARPGTQGPLVNGPAKAGTTNGSGAKRSKPGEGEQGEDLWRKDAYEIVPQGSDLILRGTPERATHYAVFAFLESLGAKFLGPDDVVYPALASVVLPGKATRSTASFSYRHVFYPTAQEPEWAIRWGLNVHHGRDARWGANALAHSLGHSFAQLVPLEKHWATHPEYFSLVDGLRRDRGQQLCCTNPEVAEIACETMARWIAENPDRRIFAVGMNDWDGWCECPECAAADEREGGPTGQLLTLVNRVAERFPDRIVATLAYAWAIDPPRETAARDNVLIVLCHNEGCYTHALDECDLNRKFIERLRGWKEKCRRILIWDYFVNYHSYLMPTPNFHRMQRDFRSYRDLGIEAMFFQGSAMHGGQFEGLRQYIAARLLWDPDRDVWQMAEEWLTGVYGAASGALILEYLRMLERHVKEGERHMPSFGSTQEMQPQIWTDEILARGKELWDRAEAAAPDECTARKVFAARAPEMCSRLFHAGLAYRVADGVFGPTPEPDFALRDRFAAAAIAGNAAHLRENDGAPEEFARNYGRSYAAVVLESELLRVTAVPELGGRVQSLVHKPTGTEMFRTIDPTRFVNFGAYDAGYEFALEHKWKGKGTAAEFAVRVRGGDGVILEAVVDPDVRIRTHYRLDGDTLHVAHTVCNEGTQPATVAPYTHPEWRFAALGNDTVVRMKRGDGSWTTMPLNPEGRTGRYLTFGGDEKPAGEWEFTSGSHPIVLRETFDPRPVEKCAIVFSTARGNCNGCSPHPFPPIVEIQGDRRVSGRNVATNKFCTLYDYA